MPKPIEFPVLEFRAQIADLMDRTALRGERFLVVKHGKPRAALVSVEDLRRLEELDAGKKPAKGK